MKRRLGEEKEGQESPVDRVESGRSLWQKLSFRSVGTGVLREYLLQAKLRVKTLLKQE